MKKKTLKYTIIGLGALWLYSEAQRRSVLPNIWYVDYIPFGYNALFIPPFGIFVHTSQANNKEILLHELVHWKQFKKEGLFKFLLGFTQENAKNGYDGNKYEIEARFSESDFCQSNYTYCVRNGLANTVHNPNFRK